jgi:hypothetical protein
LAKLFEKVKKGLILKPERPGIRLMAIIANTSKIGYGIFILSVTSANAITTASYRISISIVFIPENHAYQLHLRKIKLN